MRPFLDDISIWIGGHSKVDCPPWCKWTVLLPTFSAQALNLLKSQVEKRKMCPILAYQTEMGHLILSPLALGLKFTLPSLLLFRSSACTGIIPPALLGLQLHTTGLLSLYYHVSWCFIINLFQLIDRWEIVSVFFWRTLIYRLKSVLKIWENNPCISLLLTFFFFCCA